MRKAEKSDGSIHLGAYAQLIGHDLRTKGAALLTLVLFLELIFADCACSSDIIDYSEVPRSTDNFLEANFRFVFPDISPAPKAVLVFIPGNREY
jgi:hypothetical protein